DAVRAGAIRLRLRGLLEPFRAHRSAREVLITIALDDVVAVGDDVALQDCLHAPILDERDKGERVFSAPRKNMGCPGPSAKRQARQAQRPSSRPTHALSLCASAEKINWAAFNSEAGAGKGVDLTAAAS